MAEGETHPPELPSPVGLKINNEHLLNVVLKHTSLTGAFYDTKFYAFSRRKSDGLVYAPKAVYANGWLLRARVPAYFEQRESILSKSDELSIIPADADNLWH